MTNADMGAFCSYAQYMPYYAIMDLPNIPQRVIDHVLDNCSRNSVSLSSKQFAAAAENPDGIRELVFLSLRHKHPNITREQVRAMESSDLSNIYGLINLLARSPDELEPSKHPEDQRADVEKKREAVIKLINMLKENSLLA